MPFQVGFLCQTWAEKNISASFSRLTDVTMTISAHWVAVLPSGSFRPTHSFPLFFALSRSDQASHQVTPLVRNTTHCHRLSRLLSYIKIASTTFQGGCNADAANTPLTLRTLPPNTDHLLIRTAAVATGWTLSVFMLRYM